MVLFFKIIRKIKIYLKSLSVKYKLFELKTMYKKRFKYGGNLYFDKFFNIVFDNSFSSIVLGDNIQFRKYCNIVSSLNGKLSIGNRVFFNNSCSINCLYEITIGDDCQFGEGVKLYDHNHDFKNIHLKINEQGFTKGSINIGRNCWIGSNVVILKNVTIGDNVVIGAGCIIYNSVSENSIIINNQLLVNKYLSN